MKTIAQILEEYGAKSKDPEYAGYNPLQCAAYDGDGDDVQALIYHYDSIKTTLAELSYVSPADRTKENILHVAMKHPAVFSLICWAIEEHDKSLFAQLIAQGDVDDDTVFHQIAEFGRAPSLKHLVPYVTKCVDPAELQAALLLENKHQETASEIAEHGVKSITVQSLVEAKILTPEHLDNARKHRDEIQRVFSHQLQAERMAASM